MTFYLESGNRTVALCISAVETGAEVGEKRRQVELLQCLDWDCWLNQHHIEGSNYDLNMKDNMYDK